VLIAAATFALILAIVLGAYWVLVVRVEQLASERLRNHRLAGCCVRPSA
jgi:hypothetical protein